MPALRKAATIILEFLSDCHERNNECFITRLPVAPEQGTKVHSHVAKRLQLSQKENIVAQRDKSHLKQYSVCHPEHDDSQYTELETDR